MADSHKHDSPKHGVSLHLHGISKRYANNVTALDAVSLDIASGELVALLGPSGSGKTTLLRVIAGLLHPDNGRLLFGDTDATRLRLRERNVGFVFQHYALFKHMTVAENVAFGLRSRPWRKRPKRAVIAQRVQELLTLIQLPDHGSRYPEQLSGGQKQRVALARALAIDPTVLLLDEPFGALDAKVRVELRRWLRKLHEQTGQTTVFVTHDQDEALELADRVVVLRDGRIEQVGTPEDIYAAPASAYVFEFIGRANVIEGQVANGVFSIQDQSWHLPADDLVEGAAKLYVRPHDFVIAPVGEGLLRGHVVAAHRLADRIVVEVALPERSRTLEIDLVATPGIEIPAPGNEVGLRPLRFRIFPATEDQNGGA
ncbi:sulfate/molybdate ABC transporter ATP-binding protein [Luteimonas panaciterrae]|uniref:sulfate/molybdate ABC transporter ATP-binding protein n=1 Tax=Luteimonas panaciterrae TaxID=363885 RepID=UPI001CFB7E99|nr:sulfate/molybdate ABC transporter ATP-binding protein [Luteimonas panaciterrae]